MQPAVLDALNLYIRARVEAAARDKLLYEQDGARLNAQLLQGEINMGAAVLEFLARQDTSAPLASGDIDTDEDEDDGEVD